MKFIHNNELVIDPNRSVILMEKTQQTQGAHCQITVTRYYRTLKTKLLFKVDTVTYSNGKTSTSHAVFASQGECVSPMVNDNIDVDKIAEIMGLQEG